MPFQITEIAILILILICIQRLFGICIVDSNSEYPVFTIFRQWSSIKVDILKPYGVVFNELMLTINLSPTLTGILYV